MLSGVGYQKNRSRYGTTYYDYRKFLKEFDQYSLEEQLEYQRKELIQFLKFTYENSLFYRELYKDVELNAIQTVDDLKSLPTVDKELLRQNMEQVTTIKRNKAVVHHTSGSTGKPFEVLLTKEDMMKRSAQLDHYKARLGFENLKMRKASFSGQFIVPINQKQKKFWRYNAPSKQMFYSTYHINEENIPSYIEHLKQFRPQALDGYFSAMVSIAEYMERHKISLDCPLVGIFPTAETLTPSGKKLLERVFHCKVYDQYASSEGAPFITECSEQNLHMELASGVFEHFTEDSNEVLVTSFTTHGTPLIRYKIGDVILFEETDKSCSCGAKTPLVKSIEGRSLDYLQTKDGRKLYITNVLGVFDDLPAGIVQAQFIQNKIDEVILLLQTDAKSFQQEYKKTMRKKFYSMFSEKTQLLIEHVENIPKEKNGKFRMIKNNLNQ